MQPTPTEPCPIPRRENLLALMRWYWLHENARAVPLHLLAPAEREIKIAAFAPRDERREDLARWLRDELAPELARYEDRRRVEAAIADKLDREGFDFELVESLRACRKHGDLGALKEEGGPRKIIMWKHKCGQNRLCPDEAREEQMRLVERYVPAIESWHKARRGRQVQYVVLTWPNVPAGELAAMKRAMFRHLARWLKLKCCRAVKGCLAVQEDPLGRDGRWNLHVNLILLVEGFFDWSAARAAWFQATRHLFDQEHRDFQVHFKDVTRGNLMRAVLELVKYSAKHLAEEQAYDDDKSSIFAASAGGVVRGVSGENERHEDDQAAGDRQDQGAAVLPRAPGLVDWPGERLHEWYRAGLRFRRTRSYGALFAVKEIEPEKIDKDKVQWIGRVDWNDDRAGYDVTITGTGPIDLIPDHNSDRARDHNSPPRAAGPPDPDGWHHG